MPLRDLALAIFFPLVCLAATGRPWMCVAIWAWMDYMNPHRLCYGAIKFIVPFSMIIACWTAINFVVTPQMKRFALTRESVLIVLWMAWITITPYFALYPAAAWREWDRAFKAQILIIITLFLFRNIGQLRALVWTIAVSIGFYGVKGGVFTLLTGGGSRVRGPEMSYIEDNNDIALAMVVVMPLMRYLQLTSKHHWVRLGLMVAMALTTLSVVASYSRAGLLALAAVVVMMVLKSRKKVVFGFTLILVVIAIFNFMPQAWFDRMNTITNYENDASAQGRLNAWRFSWTIAQNYPIFGGGFKVFNKDAFQRFSPDPENDHEAHNVFLKIMAEHGFPGLTLILMLYGFAFLSGRWVQRNAAQLPEVATLADLAAMLQVSLAGYIVGGSFSNLAYFSLPYHLVAMIVLCRVIVTAELYHAAAKPEPAAAEGGKLVEAEA